MKTIIISLVVTLLFIGCKKEETPPPAPSTSGPTPTTVTVRISLVDVVGAVSIFNPKMIGVKVTSTGTQTTDTVFNRTITNWAQLGAFPTTDVDCNNVYASFPSDSITYTGVDDGSYIRIFFFEGSTWKHACRAYYGDGNISSNSSAGGVIEHYVYSPPLITVSW